LSIVDAGTHFRLWNLLAPVNGAIGRLTSDKNLAAGMTSLMDYLKKLSVQADALAGGNK
jgi:hypothetical protein